MKKQVRLFVSGSVQGVFFRGTCMREAARCRVAGFARNLPDGRVEVVAEGEERNLLKIVSWCRKGPPMARVEGVEVSWGEPTGQYQGFNPG